MAESYQESFGLPSSILEIAQWDHEMLVMWADAIQLTATGVQRLSDAAHLTGVSVAEAADSLLNMRELLDEDDLQLAMDELDALRELRRLQPLTQVSCSGAGGFSSAIPTGDAWMAALQKQAQDDFERCLNDAASINIQTDPEQRPLATGHLQEQDAAFKSSQSHSAAAPPPLVHWGSDWDAPDAPGIFGVGRRVVNPRVEESMDSSDLASSSSSSDSAARSFSSVEDVNCGRGPHRQRAVDTVHGDVDEFDAVAS